MNKGWMKAVYFGIAVAGVAAVAANIAINSASDASRQETINQAATVRLQTDRQASADKARIIASYGRQPMGFEENIGQTDAQVRFTTRGRGYALFLTPEEAVLALTKQPAAKPQINQPQMESGVSPEMAVAEQMETRVLRMRMAGANTAPEMTGLAMQSGKSNYIHGNDPKQWTTGVSRYDRVLYHAVYNGIDLAFYGNQRQLEYDFVVNPGASPDAIRLAFSGADSMEIDTDGNLVLHLGDEQVIQHAPLIYQQVNGKRQAVVGGYSLAADGEVSFEVASYDTSKPLIIDPVLVYSTYLGGGSMDKSFSIAVDANGSAYVTGYTNSTDFPLMNAMQTARSGIADGFVTKLEANGQLAWSTYLGGNGFDDTGNGIAVDGIGNVYVTGSTSSTDFPLMNAMQATLGGSWDAYITKLDTNGQLVYSTYLGGSGIDEGFGIAVDAAGNAYVTGLTSSTDFPLLNAMQIALGGYGNAFITKLDANGQLAYSTYLGGNYTDVGFGVAVDGAGNAYVTGETQSTDFPLLNAMQVTLGGPRDAFITKLDGNGQLAWSTYLGGSSWEEGNGIAVDATGNIYVAGRTLSTDFPLLNAIQTVFGGSSTDAFVTKLDAAGALSYSTYLGGDGLDNGNAIVVDALGNAIVAGRTSSSDFPLLNTMQAVRSGYQDAFITKLDTAGALSFSTYLGGSINEFGYGVAVDSTGNIYVAGLTQSTDFPLLNAMQAVFGGPTYDGFVTKIGFNQPPVADAGQDQTVECSGGSSSSVTLDGSASSDPDPNDVLTYSWTGPFGTVTGVNPTVTMSLGANQVVTLTVDDGNGHTATDTVLITVQDSMPPTVSAGPDATIEATGPNGADYDVSAQASASDTCCGATLTAPSLATYPLGDTTVTVTAVDCAGNPASDTMVVHVVDTTAPAVTAELIPVSIDDDEDKDKDEDEHHSERHSEGLFRVVFTVSDIADANPAVTATLNGQAVSNGQIVKLERDDEAKTEFEHGQLEIKGMSFTLNISATDASGNVGTASDAYAFPVGDEHHGGEHHKSKKHDKDD